MLAFTDTEGSATGSLLPTGNVRDTDRRDRGHLRRQRDARRDRAGGVLRAHRLRVARASWPPTPALLARVDAFRRKAGRADGPRATCPTASVPKTVLLAAPRDGGQVCTRSFIPVQPHTSIGVLGAVSVVTGMLLPGAVGHELDRGLAAPARSQVDVEHPTGHLLVDVVVDGRRHAATGRPLRRRPHRPQALRRHRLPRSLTPDPTDIGESCPRCTTSRTSPTSSCSPTKPDESLDFFVRYLGMTENGSAGDSVYLRAWDDYENATIKLTAAPRPGVGPHQLPRQQPRGAAAAGGRDRGDRAGHRLAGRRPGLRPGLRLHRPRRPRAGRLLRDRVVPAHRRPRAGAEEPGAGLPGPRRERAADRPHQLPRRRRRGQPRLRCVDVLGGMVTEQIVLDDGGRRQLDDVHQQGLRRRLHPRQHRHRRAGCTTSPSPSTPATTSSGPPTSPSSRASTSRPGRTSTPSSRPSSSTSGSPAATGSSCATPGARLVLAPDWQPVDWIEAERAKGQAWGLQTIATFHTHGTPPVDPA